MRTAGWMSTLTQAQRHGEQLGADDSRQGLVHDPSPLWSTGAVVQQDLAAGGDRAAAVARQWRACLAALDERPENWFQRAAPLRRR